MSKSAEFSRFRSIGRIVRAVLSQDTLKKKSVDKSIQESSYNQLIMHCSIKFCRTCSPRAVKLKFVRGPLQNVSNFRVR